MVLMWFQCLGIDLKDAISMFPWDPGSRYSYNLIGKESFMNGKCYLLVPSFLLESWHTWWNLLSASSVARTLAWRPIWTILRIKPNVSEKWSLISMWQPCCSYAVVGQLTEWKPSWCNLNTYLSWFPLEYHGKDYCITWGQNHPGGSMGSEAH